MTVNKNISLKPYNSFGIDVLSKIFIEVNNISELKKTLKAYKKCFVLGGGSNMLLTKPIDIPVIKLNLKGITCKPSDNNTVLVSAKAGENWHDFVLWCINKNYGGLENLSLIPGTIGACPIQNIGAYGVEVKDIITQVEALEISTQKIKTFNNLDCKFEYRNSIFKSTKKGKYIILKVTFKLTTNNHNLNMAYGAIKSELANIAKPTIKQISDAVIKIRSAKLPNPKKIGNSGSFFKNPIIDLSQFKELQKVNPNIPFYKISKNKIKIPAGWLIEKCGFKGKRFGDAGVHRKQALVLVNYGNATGNEILKLSNLIQKTVTENFNINLQTEVNIF